MLYVIPRCLVGGNGFDAGGVASGPMTATFILGICPRAAQAMKERCINDVLNDCDGRYDANHYVAITRVIFKLNLERVDFKKMEIKKWCSFLRIGLWNNFGVIVNDGKRQ